MNFSIRPLSIIVGSIILVLTFFTIKVPLLSVGVGAVATFLTESLLRIQDRS